MLNVVMLSVAMPSVVILIVVAFVKELRVTLKLKRFVVINEASRHTCD